MSVAHPSRSSKRLMKRLLPPRIAIKQIHSTPQRREALLLIPPLHLDVIARNSGPAASSTCSSSSSIKWAINLFNEILDQQKATTRHQPTTIRPLVLSFSHLLVSVVFSCLLGLRVARLPDRRSRHEGREWTIFETNLIEDNSPDTIPRCYFLRPSIAIAERIILPNIDPSLFRLASSQWPFSTPS